mmetsp:Transcript_93647/g.227520  ORF Transcript_93647/g.227520 Transcript_93647/m.227520 type:complete len:200 (-) Transcript_93647:136-735(-)
MNTSAHQCTSGRYLMKRNFQRIWAPLSWNQEGAAMTVLRKRPPKPPTQRSTAVMPIASMLFHSSSQQRMLLSATSDFLSLSSVLLAHLNSRKPISATEAKKVNIRERKPFKVRFGSIASASFPASFASSRDSAHVRAKTEAMRTGPTVLNCRRLEKLMSPIHCGLTSVRTSLVNATPSSKPRKLTGNATSAPPMTVMIW